jgi:hypothetical protein
MIMIKNKPPITLPWFKWDERPWLGKNDRLNFSESIRWAKLSKLSDVLLTWLSIWDILQWSWTKWVNWDWSLFYTGYRENINSTWNIVITGVWFTPKIILFIAGAYYSWEDLLSWGYYNPLTTRTNVSLYYTNTATTHISIDISDSIYLDSWWWNQSRARWVSMDTDWFTINVWEYYRTFSFIYLCFR